LDGIELGLDVLEFDAQVGIFSVEVVVAMDLAGKSPVVVGEESIVQDLKVSSGAHHEKAEPCWDGRCWFGLALFIVLVVCLGI